MSALFPRPKCIYCDEEIEKNGQAIVIIEYPKRKGFTEMKAYLELNGKFVCAKCKGKLDV